MREVPILKLAALVLLAGLAVGGWRSWHLDHDGRPLVGSGDGVARIELLTTADKASWVRAQAYSFNYLHQGQYVIAVKYLDSREAMQKVLAGAERPVLWSPESPVWIARADDIWRGRTHRDLVAMDDFSSFRVFLRSPLVFLTTREKADFLRPYLSGSHPWTSIHDMCSGRIDVPSGKLRFSIADPLRSNSGDASVDMMLTEFAAEHHAGGELTDVAGDPKFAEFVATIGKGVVVDRASKRGTLDLEQEYAANPSTRDFIVTYENLALTSATKNRDLVVIYPSPTVVAEQSVGIVDAPWVSPAQKAGAAAFMDYVSRPESLKSGLKYDMRSALTGADAGLQSRLASHGDQGFQTTFTTEETAPYQAVNTAAAQWLKHIGA